MGAERSWVARVGQEERRVVVEPLGAGKWRVVLDGVERVVEALFGEQGQLTFLLDGRVVMVDVERDKLGGLKVDVEGTSVGVALVEPRELELERARAMARGARAAVRGPEAVLAPMPGKVVRLLVRVGEQVVAGQALAVIEAMKMENELRAPREATVRELHVAEGTAVEAHQPVVTLE